MHTMRMRTTLNLQDDLVAKAMEISHINSKTELIHKALALMISEYSRKRLMALGSSQPDLEIPHRRRSP
jgi:Arc/MetJ family transcription regulator